MFSELLNEVPGFLNNVFQFIDELGIDVSDLEIDHVALRFKKKEDVDKISQELIGYGDQISAAVVNERRILIIKLFQPIRFRHYTIPCVELPYPAKDHNYPEDGWEHVEFVLPTSDISEFDQVFKQRFSNLTEDQLRKYGYRLSVPRVSSEQLLNPTAILTKDKMLSVKFHPNSIEDVVKSTS